MSVTPTTSAQTLTPTSPKNGFTEVSVSAVTSSIDSNISAGNIKKDIVILGVTGTYEGSGGSSSPARPFNANFWVDTTGGVHNIGNNKNNTSTGSAGGVLGANATTISTDYAYSGAYSGSTDIAKLDLSSITSITGYEALGPDFSDPMGFPKPPTFSGCTNLISIDFSSLVSVSEWALCSAFANCTSLTNVLFPALTNLSSDSLNGTFSGCTNLISISFPALTTNSFSINKTDFYSMLNNTGTNTIHTLHFPSNMESTISGLTGYPLFGGTSGYVVLAFDLPATS